MYDSVCSGDGAGAGDTGSSSRSSSGNVCGSKGESSVMCLLAAAAAPLLGRRCVLMMYAAAHTATAAG